MYKDPAGPLAALAAHPTGHAGRAIPEAAPEGAAPLLRLEAVGKTYLRGGQPQPVLREVSLSLQAGERLALIGQSGCGKSTLLRLMAGIDGEHAGRIARAGAFSQSVVFQEHRLFPWLSALDNVLLGTPLRHSDRTAARQRARDALALVGLADAAGRYPHELSGGMAQRAAIARALVGAPAVLFLDEPFGALDALTRVRLQQELDTISRRQGIALDFVTHDVEEAVFLADKVLVIQPQARGQDSIAIDLPGVRDRQSPAFLALRARLAGALATAPDAGG